MTARGKSKVISSGTMTGARGGKTPMFGKSGVGPREPGVTSPTRNPPSGGFSVSGGTTKMFGKQSVKQLKPV